MGTGVLLKFVYEPLPEKAYESILASLINKISNEVKRLNNISNFRQSYAQDKKNFIGLGCHNGFVCGSTDYSHRYT
jgi:hypothetical protein